MGMTCLTAEIDPRDWSFDGVNWCPETCPRRPTYNQVILGSVKVQFEDHSEPQTLEPTDMFILGIALARDPMVQWLSARDLLKNVKTSRCPKVADCVTYRFSVFLPTGIVEQFEQEFLSPKLGVQ